MTFLAYAFMLLQALDILTTALAMRLGFVELNPLGYNAITVGAKVIIAVIVAVIIKRGRVRCGVPVTAVSALAVTWNTLALLAEVI